MSYLDRSTTQSTRLRSSSAPWSDDTWPSSRSRRAPIWIAGILIVLCGILIMVFLSQLTSPAEVQVALPTEPSTSTPPASAARSSIPPKQAAAQPPVARGGSRITSAAAIAVVPASADSEIPVASSAAAADVRTSAPAAAEVKAETISDAPPAVPAGLYTIADADVTPPAPISHSWLNELPGGLVSERGVTIEFTVNERGVVESARVRDEAQSLGESMLFAMSLHSLKTWQFRPALKDGSPVRYRQLRFFGGTGSQLPPAE